MNEFIAIAVVTSISVKDGLLKIKVLSDNQQQILNQNFIFFDFFGNIKKFIVDEIILRGRNIFIKLKNFHQERELKIFLNKEIYIPKKSFVLQKDEYLVSDLLDCKVYFRKKFIGIVDNVLDIPMNYILEIKDKENKKLMIPFVLKFFDKIDAEKKVIYLSKESRFLYDEN